MSGKGVNPNTNHSVPKNKLNTQRKPIILSTVPIAIFRINHTGRYTDDGGAKFLLRQVEHTHQPALQKHRDDFAG